VELLLDQPSLLAIGLVAGVIISLLQIVTSIQDPSFSAVPRLLVFFAAILLMLHG